MEIRCQNRKFGEVTEDATGEYRAICNSRYCKLYGNEVVLHVWNLEKLNEDGKTVVLIDTKRFKRPT